MAENDVLPTARMMADRLRPIAAGGETSCLNGTHMVPLHIATVTTIWNILENVARAEEGR